MPQKFVDKGTMTLVRNNQLACKDCQSLNQSRTDICNEYLRCKPLRVLKGGECQFYKKRQDG